MNTVQPVSDAVIRFDSARIRLRVQTGRQYLELTFMVRDGEDIWPELVIVHNDYYVTWADPYSWGPLREPLREAALKVINSWEVSGMWSAIA
jgi:hypothetical protein